MNENRKSSGILFLCLLALACSPAAHTLGSDQAEPQQDGKVRLEGDPTESDEAGEQPTCTELPPLDGNRWFQGRVGYEIFVRSFQDSDGDGKGDLAGLSSRLDYLNDGDEATASDLGVTLLWLMPTFPSPSYHGYDVTDFEGVNPEYGTTDDLKKLVEEAHKRGIAVVLDLILNHTSSKHPWFIDAQVPGSGKRGWYVWSDEAQTWPQPWGGKTQTWHKLGDAWYYGVFWSGMPDLNYAHPGVRQTMTQTALAWLTGSGVDGFRLDAVRYIVETGPKEGQQDTQATFDWWVEFSSAIRGAFPEALLIGEAWASNQIASKYHGAGQGLELTFDFDLMEAAVNGLLAEDPTDIEKTLCAFSGLFPPGHGDATFLGNHDLLRLASRLKERPELLRLGAMLLFTLPGLPFIYYGEEIGMTNGPTLDDVHKRLPMQWEGTGTGGFTTGKPWKPLAANVTEINVAAQAGAPDSLLALYRSLIRLRKSNQALWAGGFLPLEADSKTNNHLWAFLRRHPAQTAACVVNMTETSALSAWVELPEGAAGSAVRLFPQEAGEVPVVNGRLEAGDLAPYSLTVMELRPN
jgi:glycosidase